MPASPDAAPSLRAPAPSSTHLPIRPPTHPGKMLLLFSIRQSFMRDPCGKAISAATAKRVGITYSIYYS